jgi:uncharacterized protein YhaN
MAENINALILPIGADVTQFSRSIDDIKSAIKSLSSTISATPFNIVSSQQKLELNALKETLDVLTKDVKEFGDSIKYPENSIAGLNQRIAQLNKEKIVLSADTRALDIASISQEIDILTKKKAEIENLGKTLGFIGPTTQKSLSKVQDSSKGARTALTSLSLVAQDAPFGFIAIQNNLPALIQSFGELERTSAGTKGALAQIGSALTGPAGLFLGFSVVTAAVTFAIQKYGSLGEAIKGLFGAAKPLTEAQKDFNKAVNETTGKLTVEDAKVSILTKTLLNQKAPQKDRLAAYGELKKISPDIVAGISKENALTAESSILIESNAKARKELTRLKIQEAGVSAALTTNETKLAELRNKLVIADQEYVKAAADLNKANKQAIITGFGSQTQQEIALKTLNDNISSVKQLRAQIDSLTKEQDNYLSQLDPITNGISQINEQTRERIENLKEEAKAEKEAVKENKKSLSQREKANKLREEQIRVENLYNAKKKIKEQAELNQTELENLRALSKERRKAEREAGIVFPKQISGAVPNLNNEEFLSKVRSANNELERLREAANLSGAYNVAEATFFNPISDLFENFANTGKFAFKEFAQAVIKSINQIVAKIIATGIVSLLANIFSGGFAAGGGGFKNVLTAITSALGFAGPAKIATPNIANINPGGVQMSGQVVFVQRGSDLVGVLNRTNGTINRVG